MGANETPAQEDDALTLRQDAINDSANIEVVADDARISTIARAIGRQIALEELKATRVANDNEQGKSS